MTEVTKPQGRIVETTLNPATCYITIRLSYWRVLAWYKLFYVDSLNARKQKTRRITATGFFNSESGAPSLVMARLTA